LCNNFILKTFKPYVYKYYIDRRHYLVHSCTHNIIMYLPIHIILLLLLLYERMIKSENMFHYYIYVLYYTLAIILPEQINLYVRRASLLYREKKGWQSSHPVLHYNIIYVPRTRVLIQFWRVRSCVTLYNIIYRILSICRVILLLSHNLNFRLRKRNTIFRHPAKIRVR